MRRGVEQRDTRLVRGPQRVEGHPLVDQLEEIAQRRGAKAHLADLEFRARARLEET